MPILAVLGVGALVGLAGYFGYHAVRHFFFGKGWDLSWKGAGASLAAGAVALPAALFGSGALAAATGFELTSLAVGGATSAVGAVVGAHEDPSKKATPTTPAATTTPGSSGQLNLDPSTWNTNAPVDSQSAPATTPSQPATQPSEPASPPSQPATQPSDPKPASQPVVYTVVKGDTLSAIARKEGVSLADLEKANQYIGDRPLPSGSSFKSSWDLIHPGDQISIPQSKGMVAALGNPVPGNDQ